MLAQKNPFEGTKNFSVITESDCSIQGGYINGAVAAGRNFAFSNTYIAINKTSDFVAPGEAERKTGLWVGGTISDASIGELSLGQNTVLRVANRGLWNCNTIGTQTRIGFNGGFNAYPRIVIAGQPADCGNITNMGDFSVSEVFSSLKSFGKCTESAAINTSMNGNEIILSSANSVHYSEFTRQQIESGQNFTVRGAALYKPLVVRINGGGSPVIINGSFRINTDVPQHVVLYFYNTSVLQIDNMGSELDATILAPFSDVVKNNQQAIKGQVIARTYVQNSGAAGAVAFEASLPLSASVGNYVWKDANLNGVQDAGERGVPNVSVALYDPVDDIAGNSNDALLAVTGTDYNGNYAFDDILVAPCGSKFYLRFYALPIGNNFTRALTGGADVINNSKVTSFSGGVGITNLFLLKPGESRKDMDAGISGPDISTLPLHTLTAVARLAGSNVVVDWLAENELNTKKFIVQRSIDGILFTDIKEKSATGQINTHTQYSHTDDISVLSTAKSVFYRIMALDDANRYAYSNIVFVKPYADRKIQVWPNPFTDNVTIQFVTHSLTKVNISLIDITGNTKQSYDIRTAEGANQVQLTGLSVITTGTYVLKITDLNTGSVQMQKLIK